MKHDASWLPRCPFCLSYGSGSVDPDMREHMRIVHGTGRFLWDDESPPLWTIVLGGTALALTGWALIVIASGLLP